MSPEAPWVVSIVGGASGVGKSTLLGAVGEVGVINTGSLFKARMTLENRDDVRNLQWSDYEGVVADDLATEAANLLARTQTVVIDTHFAARLGPSFRIGLKSSLIFGFSHRLVEAATKADRQLVVNVVLVTCDPHALLRRRRLDTGRSRELVPADCFNALRQNRTCSLKYLFEARRAGARAAWPTFVAVRYVVVQNDDLPMATDRLRTVIRSS